MFLPLKHFVSIIIVIVKHPILPAFQLFLILLDIIFLWFMYVYSKSKCKHTYVKYLYISI